MVSQNPDGSFTVTLADVYAEVRKVSDTVNGQGTRLAMIDELSEDSKDHETRIRSLERWKYTVPASLIGTTISIIVAAAAVVQATHK